MALHAVGVVAVAAVVGADARLWVAHVPRFGAEDAQEGGGVHRAGADLSVVRHPDEAPARRPVGLEARDGLLERRRGGVW